MAYIKDAHGWPRGPLVAIILLLSSSQLVASRRSVRGAGAESLLRALVLYHSSVLVEKLVRWPKTRSSMLSMPTETIAMSRYVRQSDTSVLVRSDGRLTPHTESQQ